MDELYAQIITGIRAELHQALTTLSQTEVAKRCKTTPATINRILHGKRGENLPFKTVLNICTGLDIDLGVLILPKVEKAALKKLLSQLSVLISNE